MVDDAVDDCRRHLVVAEHRPPLAELDVGGDDHAPLLIAVAHHLEQQSRPLYVDRYVAKLVEHDQRRLAEVLPPPDKPRPVSA